MFFEKSRIFCQEKLSQISQSTSFMHKNQKSKFHDIVLENGTKSWIYGAYFDILCFFDFIMKAEISGQPHFFDKSRFFCQANLSEISQSTSFMHKKSKVGNTQYCA